MSEEIKPNVAQASTEDARLVAEEIASGEAKAPTVDMDKDYQAAQQFSVGEGAKADQDTTAREYQIPESEEEKTEAQPTGDPADYKAMAEEIRPKQ
ncbi:hypothetical protein BLD44_003870 [Mastigocladus laminosus UU774]|nr:hypothetical protein B4U84_23360 [Westiellopsis prolifica IICB1]TFI55675.1 hypothetical protein BLD44_003870 [Mastigocladus laminosus UU774]